MNCEDVYSTEYLLSCFQRLNFSVIIELNRKQSWEKWYQLNDWTQPRYITDEMLHKVCNTVSMGHEGLGVLHTHTKIKSGGMYHPHIVHQCLTPLIWTLVQDCSRWYSLTIPQPFDVLLLINLYVYSFESFN